MKTRCPQCGAGLQVPDDAVGKKGKCPKCQHRFVVGGASMAPPAPPAEEQPLDSVLDGLSEGAAACPSCGEALAPSAVICTQCGFDSRTNQRLATKATAQKRAATAPATARTAVRSSTVAGAIGLGGGFALSIVGAACGAGLGALIWFAVERYLEIQFGYIAIGVGALAGGGAILLGKERSPRVGLLAAVAGFVGVVCGSYMSYYQAVSSAELRTELRKVAVLAVEMMPPEMLEEAYEETGHSPETHDAMIQMMVDKIIAEISYIDVMKENPEDALFMVVFSALGLFTGYKVGSGGND